MPRRRPVHPARTGDFLLTACGEDHRDLLGTEKERPGTRFFNDTATDHSGTVEAFCHLGGAPALASTTT